MAKRKAASTKAGTGTKADGLQLKFDPKNANRHTDESLTAVQLSVARLGAGRSIVADASGTVVAGEATLKAAQACGLKLREVRTNGDELVVVVREDLQFDDPRRTALAIADNQTAKLSGFDEATLTEQLRGLGTDQALLTATGFADADLIRLLNPEAAGGASSSEASSESQLPQFYVTVVCRDESHRQEILEKLLADGLECRVDGADDTDDTTEAEPS